MYQTTVIGCDAVYCSGDCDGWTDSFLGLIIANLSRQLLQTYRHSHLILGSAFFGMVILVAGQLLVEQIYSYTVPVSVFITVFGGIYFLYLLLRERKES